MIDICDCKLIQYFLSFIRRMYELVISVVNWLQSGVSDIEMRTSSTAITLSDCIFCIFSNSKSPMTFSVDILSLNHVHFAILGSASHANQVWRRLGDSSFYSFGWSPRLRLSTLPRSTCRWLRAIYRVPFANRISIIPSLTPTASWWATAGPLRCDGMDSRNTTLKLRWKRLTELRPFTFCLSTFRCFGRCRRTGCRIAASECQPAMSHSGCRARTDWRSRVHRRHAHLWPC